MATADPISSVREVLPADLWRDYPYDSITAARVLSQGYEEEPRAPTDHQSGPGARPGEIPTDPARRRGTPAKVGG